MFPQFESPGAELVPETVEYSPSERELLVKLAHQSIAAAIEARELDLTAPTPHMAELRGVFVTLHLRGRLRGCIGQVFPTQSLYRTVAEMARAAAFDDPRFEPVTRPEALALKVEVSVLSSLCPVRPEEIVVGRHGLVVSRGNRRGLLLPQVAIEWKWERETFLAQTCLKAGLAPDAWLHDAELQAFTAEVFGEEP